MCKYIDLSFSRECKSFLLHVRKTKGLTVRFLKELSLKKKRIKLSKLSPVYVSPHCLYSD